jgi:hypothetical protein
VGLCSELLEQDIDDRNGNPPWLTKAIVRTVCKIEHHDVVRSRIFRDAFPDKPSHECTKQALIILEKAMDVYMVEVIAESHY